MNINPTTPLVLAEKAGEVVGLSLDASRTMKLRTHDIAALTGDSNEVPFNIAGSPAEKVAYLVATPGRIYTQGAQAIALEMVRRANKRPRAARAVREMDALFTRACEARRTAPVTVASLAAGEHLR